MFLVGVLLETGQLPVTSARKTTIASHGTSRRIRVRPVAGERGRERTKKRSSFIRKSTRADFLLCASPSVSELACFLLTPILSISWIPSDFICFLPQRFCFPEPQALCVCSLQMGGLLKEYHQIKTCSCKHSFSSAELCWENVEFKEAVFGREGGNGTRFIHSLTHWSNIWHGSYILGIMLGIPKTGWSRLCPQEAHSDIGRDRLWTNIKIWADCFSEGIIKYGGNTRQGNPKPAQEFQQSFTQLKLERQGERTFQTEGITCRNGEARRASLGEPYKRVKVGRDHPRKSLVLHTGLFRLYTGGLLKNSEQGSQRFRFACWKVTLQQSTFEDSDILSKRG